MAIEYASTSIISRSKGHSAIKAAAYRSGERMYDDRIGQTVDYHRRLADIGYTRVLLPDNADAKFKERSCLWNEAEAAEKRRDSQLAKDHVIALPRELSRSQHKEIATAFAKKCFTDEGVAVDLNIHYHDKDNPHAHLMTTTRVLEGSGFGKKATHLNPKFSGRGRVNADEQIRHQWADFQNRYFQGNNIEAEAVNNNGQYHAQKHMGAAAHMEKDGLQTAAGEYNRLAKAQNLKEIEANPDKIIDNVSDRKSVFTKNDLYRELHRAVDDPEGFERIKSKLDNSEKLVLLNKKGKEAKYFTTQAMMEREQSIRATAEIMGREAQGHGVKNSKRKEIYKKYGYLSAEQKAAIDHITGQERVAVVVGYAGSGKSTMLKAAREAWEASGFNVKGVALAGKAAEGLNRSSGIQSSTIHRFIKQCEKKPMSYITKNSVVVMDEAGMVNSKLMKRVLDTVNASGGKLVLAGDTEQLQPIQAGSPMRDIAEINGFSEISTIRRQKTKWQRDATLDLSQGRAAAAVAAYDRAGAIRFDDSHEDAIKSLVNDYLTETRPIDSMVVLAHRRADVDQLNHSIREGRKEQGKIQGSFTVQTDNGKREFGEGDRILFRRNNAKIGVFNGSLGTVIGYDKKEGTMAVKLDNGGHISFNPHEYAYIRHGYAMTVHKAQGVTVDHAKVLATKTFDKHLAYVGLSRHRESVSVYAGRDELKDRSAMSRCFRRVNRQESVRSFARRHGLDVGDPATATREKTRDIVAGILAENKSKKMDRPQPEAGRDIAAEIRGLSDRERVNFFAETNAEAKKAAGIDEQIKASHDKAAERAVVENALQTGGGAGELSTREAKEILEKAEDRYLRQEMKKIAAIESGYTDKVLTAEKAVAMHEKTRPKPVLGLGKRRLEQWEKEHETLTKQERHARVDKRLWNDNERPRLEFAAKKEAKKKAHRKNPEASKILAEYEKKVKREKRAKDTKKKKALMKRLVISRDRLKDAEKEIDSEAIAREKKNIKEVIREIDVSVGIQKTLDKGERKQIEQAQKMVMGRGMGIGF